MQLELERANLEKLFAETLAIKARSNALASEAARQQEGVLRRGTIAGQELAALGAHRRYVALETARLAKLLEQCAGRIEAQTTRVKDAERKLKLLEKLKSRRLAAWQKATDLEVESTASELHLAQWGRRS